MTVCDREGDFWKLLARAKETGAAILVRASKSNKRRAELPSGERTCLWEHMREAKSLGGRTVEAPERGGPFRRKARTARLTVRCEAVDLVPPVEVGGATMRMVAVSAREERPAKAVEAKKEALHWLLPATEGEPGAGTAATALVRAQMADQALLRRAQELCAFTLFKGVPFTFIDGIFVRFCPRRGSRKRFRLDPPVFFAREPASRTAPGALARPGLRGSTPRSDSRFRAPGRSGRD